MRTTILKWKWPNNNLGLHGSLLSQNNNNNTLAALQRISTGHWIWYSVLMEHYKKQKKRESPLDWMTSNKYQTLLEDRFSPFLTRYTVRIPDWKEASWCCSVVLVKGGSVEPVAPVAPWRLEDCFQPSVPPPLTRSPRLLQSAVDVVRVA